MTTGFAVAVALLLVTSVSAWTEAARRLKSGSPLVVMEPRRPVPWTAAAVVGSAALYVLLPSLAAGIVAARPVKRVDAAAPGLRPEVISAAADGEAAPRSGTAGSRSGTTRDRRQAGSLPSAVRLRMIVAGSLASLSAAAISMICLRWTSPCSIRDLGWDTAHLASDVRLGATAFAMLAPPVYALQLALVHWFPSRHPLVEILERSPDPRWLIAGGLVAVLAAPVVEEYFFRVLLQGFLEAHASAGIARTAADDGSPQQGAANSADAAAVDFAPPPRWPVFVSAGIFAGVHIGHGPDPLPLFVLALGLGYLYRQTHRVLPSIVVHSLLNAFSLATLAISRCS